VGAKRTPFGAYGGKLKDKTPVDLQEIASRAALTAANVKPEIVDSVVVGNVISAASPDTAYLARHVLLRCGIPEGRPAYNVNRLCGSGFQSIVNGAQEIMLGESEIVLAGGVDNMSMTPHALRGIRFGVRLGLDVQAEDSLWVTLTDRHCNLPMGMTAENLADKYQITRQDTDNMALKSQTNWKQAQEGGRFTEEMAGVKIKVKGKEDVLTVDEHPRLTTPESLAKLPAVFKKNGTVTAGSASGVCDGAGAVILASEDAVKKHNLKPLARLAAYSVAGCDPKIMGIGPVPAIRNLLQKSGKNLNEIDLVEVNEAFAAQFLAVEKELGLDPSKTNVNGGAIALGHPLAASGSRITAHLVHELRRRGVKYGIGSACIGGGQGIAVLLESIK